MSYKKNIPRISQHVEQHMCFSEMHGLRWYVNDITRMLLGVWIKRIMHDIISPNKSHKVLPGTHSKVFYFSGLAQEQSRKTSKEYKSRLPMAGAALTQPMGLCSTRRKIS